MCLQIGLLSSGSCQFRQLIVEGKVCAWRKQTVFFDKKYIYDPTEDKCFAFFMFRRIQRSNPPIPKSFSNEVKDLILRLLTKDSTHRLGAKGSADIKKHAFFRVSVIRLAIEVHFHKHFKETLWECVNDSVLKQRLDHEHTMHSGCSLNKALSYSVFSTSLTGMTWLSATSSRPLPLRFTMSSTPATSVTSSPTLCLQTRQLLYRLRVKTFSGATPMWRPLSSSAKTKSLRTFWHLP